MGTRGRDEQTGYSQQKSVRGTQGRRHIGRGGGDDGGGRARVREGSRIWEIYTGHGEARISETILIYTGGTVWLVHKGALECPPKIPGR